MNGSIGKLLGCDPVGVFMGFKPTGLEFHAAITFPHRGPGFSGVPLHGQFILVGLGGQDEALLGRVTTVEAGGSLSYGHGEDYHIRSIEDGRVVPDDIMEQYLRYKVDVRLMGVVREVDGEIQFVPSLRRIPPTGSPVALPSETMLQALTGHNDTGAIIGHMSLGEYFYGPSSELVGSGIDFVPQPEHARVTFDVGNLVSRRTLVFARAGFGKSNLTKLLFSELYKNGSPTVSKRDGTTAPVGTVLFDPDGEYFWPDNKGRPGLCDVTGMEDQLVVFTDRTGPSPYYQSFVAGGTKLDIRRLSAASVISAVLEPDRQTQQNVIKLKNTSAHNWSSLVDAVYRHGYSTDTDVISKYTSVKSAVELNAVLSNMNRIIKSMHDPNSSVLDTLLGSLKDGKLCVMDVSQKSQPQSLDLSGLILNTIFKRNQDGFTSQDDIAIPTIAAIEEAQSVLTGNSESSQAFISWVKEGRKYDLGAVLVTQQPGSLPQEILSQGDNWFTFHLLSEGDLKKMKSANAHFSTDILSSLLNEPLPGQGVFWSSASKRQYPLPLRIRDFEGLTQRADPDYDRGSVPTYSGSVSYDSLDAIKLDVLHRLREDPIYDDLAGERGHAWGGVNAVICKYLPSSMPDAKEVAYSMVVPAMIEFFGPQGIGWETFEHPTTGNTWIRKIKKDQAD